jgi:hypothetical protein
MLILPRPATIDRNSNLRTSVDCFRSWLCVTRVKLGGSNPILLVSGSSVHPTCFSTDRISVASLCASPRFRSRVRAALSCLSDAQVPTPTLPVLFVPPFAELRSFELPLRHAAQWGL